MFFCEIIFSHVNVLKEVDRFHIRGEKIIITFYHIKTNKDKVLFENRKI